MAEAVLEALASVAADEGVIGNCLLRATKFAFAKLVKRLSDVQRLEPKLYRRLSPIAAAIMDTAAFRLHLAALHVATELAARSTGCLKLVFPKRLVQAVAALIADDRAVVRILAGARLIDCNLEGSRLEAPDFNSADFYLVDLRETRLDAWQRDHVANCGAILESAGG